MFFVFKLCYLRRQEAQKCLLFDCWALQRRVLFFNFFQHIVEFIFQEVIPRKTILGFRKVLKNVDDKLQATFFIKYTITNLKNYCVKYYLKKGVKLRTEIYKYTSLKQTIYLLSLYLVPGIKLSVACKDAVIDKVFLFKAPIEK